MPPTDKYVNIANGVVQESAANTITFNQLQTGIATFEKTAMVISRIEYEPSIGTIGALAGEADQAEFGWTTSDELTSLAKTSSRVIDKIGFGVYVFGTPASAQMYPLPFVKDYSNLPGGGLIVPSVNLYLAALGTSLGVAIYARSTLFFTYLQLKADDYWELVEATRALSS